MNPWLVSLPHATPLGPTLPDLADMRVNELLCPLTNEWNLEKIRLYLPQYEGSIRSIITSSSPLQDSLIWLAEKSGCYSTRSGYGLAMTDCIHTSPTDFLWNKYIWNLKTSPKLKDFLWKVVKKAVPVSCNLSSCGAPTFPCKRCNGFEDDIHVFLQCTIASQVWDLAPISPRPNSNISSFSSLLTWLYNSARTLPPIGLTVPLWPWLLWFLWKSRNLLAFENRQVEASELIRQAICAAKEWQDSQARTSPPMRLPSAPVHVPYSLPLRLETTHVHVDAAWDANSSTCGLGGIFSFTNGGSLSEFSASRSFVSSSLIAKALAIRMAVLTASSANARSLIVLSDSQTVVKLLQSKESRGELVSILSDIAFFSRSFEFIDFVFIPRLCNRPADLVAKSALALALSTPSIIGV